MKNILSKITMDQLLEKICETLEVDIFDVLTSSRKAELVQVRQIFCQIAFALLRINGNDVSDIIKRDRTSVNTSVKACDDRLYYDIQFKANYDACLLACINIIQKYKNYANNSSPVSPSVVAGAQTARRTDKRLEQIVSICSMAQASRSKTKGKSIMRMY